MIVEPVRIVTSWLQDPAHGVNALLPSTPRYAGDAEPPPVLTFVDATSDPSVALGFVPGPYPAIGVHLATTIEKWQARLSDDLMVHNAGDGELGVVVRLVTDDVEPADAFVMAGYRLRTIARSLRRLMGAPGFTARAVNGFQLLQSRGLFLHPMHEKAGSAYTVGAWVARWGIRDSST